MTDILVLVEHEGGTPKKVSNQILTAAKQIGDGEVTAAIFGEGARSAADKVGEYGATTAFVWVRAASVAARALAISALPLVRPDAT